jgi:hypothetical protein
LKYLLSVRAGATAASKVLGATENRMLGWLAVCAAAVWPQAQRNSVARHADIESGCIIVIGHSPSRRG